MPSKNRKPAKSPFRLSPLRKESACQGCPLHRHFEVQQQVTTEYYPRQDKSVDVMLIAEAPGAEENVQGRPFIGRSGQVLRRVVKRICGGPAGLAYGNVVRCRPTRPPKGKEHRAQNRPPSQKETHCCRVGILQDIERLRPKVIVLLGDTAAKSIARNRDGSTIDPKAKVNTMRGHDYLVRLSDGTEVPAIVTYHFSHVYRHPETTGVFREDIGKAIRRARGQLSDYSYRGDKTLVLNAVPQVKKFLSHLIKNLTKDDVVAFDYETTGLQRLGNKILCCSFSYRKDKSVVIPVDHQYAPWSGPELKHIKRLLRKFFRVRNPSFRSLVAHNAQFEDIVTLGQLGTHILMPIEDTRQRAHALNEDRKDVLHTPYGLKALVEEQLGFYHYHDDDIRPTVDLRNQGKLAEAQMDPLAQYNGMDAYVTYRLYRWQEQWASAEGYADVFAQVSLELHGPISRVLSAMEYSGLLADKRRVQELMQPDSPIQVRMDELLEELYSLDTVKQANRKLVGHKASGRGAWGTAREDAWVYKVGSPDSKRMLFFDVLDLKPEKVSKKTDKASVGKELFKKYEGVREIDIYAEYTGLQKILSTYVKGISRVLHTDPDAQDGRVRPHFNPTGTITGRISSSNPNMLNIPSRAKTEAAKAIKRLYQVPPGWCMVVADYSQAEVRWLAEATQDPFLVKAFQDAYEVKRLCRLDPTPENRRRSKLEGDFHRHTAARINKVDLESVTKSMRSAAKCVHPQTIVFADARPTQIQHLGKFGAEDTFVSSAGTALDAGGGWTAPLAALYNGGTKPLVHVVARRGILTCSREHRLELQDGVLKRASDITPDDVLSEVHVPLVADYTIPTIDVVLRRGLPTLQYTPTLDTAYFAGLYMGDGTNCISTGAHTVGISHGSIKKTDQLGVPYQDWQDLLVDACDRVGLSTCIRHEKSVYLGGRHTKAWLTALDLLCKDGKNFAIPQWVWRAGKTALGQFLGGMFDTDGTVTAQGSLSVTTKSAVLAGHVGVALNSLGLEYTMEPCWNKTYERWYYRLRLTVASSWACRTWVRHPGKHSRLHKPTYLRPLKENKVLQVIDAGEGPCLDVTVDTPDHLYCANGFVTHNSIVFGIVYGMTEQGLSSRLSSIEKRKVTVKEAVRFIDQFFAQFPTAKKWLDQMEQTGFRDGFVLSPTGRRKQVSSWVILGREDPETLRGPLQRLRSFYNHEMRVCRNAPIQGVASDTNLLACSRLLDTIEREKLDWRIINTVYDSIMLEVPFPDAERCIETAQGIMEDHDLFQAFGLQPKVPFAADFSVGVNWGDQFEITYDGEAWDVVCRDCGTKRSEEQRPTNRRCEECGSTRVTRRITEGPRDLLLRQIDRDHQLSARW